MELSLVCTDNVSLLKSSYSMCPMLYEPELLVHNRTHLTCLIKLQTFKFIRKFVIRIIMHTLIKNCCLSLVFYPQSVFLGLYGSCSSFRLSCSHFRVFALSV